MSQNLVSLSVSDEAMKEIEAALASLEKHLDGLISLSVAERGELVKMGPKSETFARKAHDVLVQSPDILPRSFSVEEFGADIRALDQLRPVFLRIAALAGRAEDTEMALGSDIMNAALDGYRFAESAGKGTALDELRAQAAVRFGKGGRGAGGQAAS